MSAPIQTQVGGATVNITCTAGNTLVITQGITGVPGYTYTSVTTDHSETMTDVDNGFVASTGNGASGGGGYILNCVGGATVVTLNRTGTTTPLLMVREYAAADAISFDLHAVNTVGGGTNPTSGATGTTTFATETVVGWMIATTGSTATAGTGFGNLTANGTSQYMEDKYVTSTGAQTANFTDSTSLFYRCGVMTFKGTAPTVNTGGGNILLMRFG